MSEAEVIKSFEDMTSNDLDEIILALQRIKLFKKSDRKTELEFALLRRFVRVFDQRLSIVEKT